MTCDACGGEIGAWEVKINITATMVDNGFRWKIEQKLNACMDCGKKLIDFTKDPQCTQEEVRSND